MGADLYIEKFFRENKKKYEKKFYDAIERRDNAVCEEDKERFQKEVTFFYEAMQGGNGYFRDSYNPTGVLQYLNFSWWVDISQLLDKGNHLKGDNLLVFFQMVISAELELPSAKDLKLSKEDIESKDNNLESWHTYLKEKYQQLIYFLALAIETNQPIYASL